MCDSRPFLPSGLGSACKASAAWQPMTAPSLTRFRACMAAQERAFEESQKYKEGKFILEKARLMKVSFA